jgi:phosphate transport system substrate-binding protein
MSSQKNETAVLVLTLLITAGVLAGGFWWLTRNSSTGIKEINGSQPQPTSSPSTSNLPSAPQSSSSNFISISGVPQGLFNYGGSTSWATIRQAIDPQIRAAFPEFQLRYVEPTNAAPGTSTGIRMLIEGRLAFAQSSRPLQDQEVSRAQQRGFYLKQIPVAIDGLAIAVHPSLNLPGLTLAQLKAIYTGKITNWKQLGGPNLPIKPYSRPISDGGTAELFVQDVLAGQAPAANVEFVGTTTQALQKLASNRGGIYYASAPEVVPQCTIRPLPLGRQPGQFVPPYQEPLVAATNCPRQRNQLNTDAFQTGQYPLTRNLYVVVKQDDDLAQQAGEAYAKLLLTQQGQSAIAQAGFVRMR